MVKGEVEIEEENVALHAEGVDRNYIRVINIRVLAVALHAEGVDRNS